MDALFAIIADMVERCGFIRGQQLSANSNDKRASVAARTGRMCLLDQLLTGRVASHLQLSSDNNDDINYSKQALLTKGY